MFLQTIYTKPIIFRLSTSVCCAHNCGGVMLLTSKYKVNTAACSKTGYSSDHTLLRLILTDTKWIPSHCTSTKWLCRLAVKWHPKHLQKICIILCVEMWWWTSLKHLCYPVTLSTVCWRAGRVPLRAALQLNLCIKYKYVAVNALVVVLN